MKPTLTIAALLALTVLPAAAAPILSPSTTTYGGIVSGGDFVTGAPTAGFTGNAWPAAEDPSKVVDGVIGGSSKYLNFNVTFTAVLFSGSNARVANRIELWVANDSPERDPASFFLYGTNTAIPALSSGQNFAVANFTLIGGGTLALPDTRDTFADATGFSQIIPIPNTTAYASYLLFFPSVKGPGANSMQISEVQIYDSVIIGTDSFDYPDGPIAGKSGGQLWNYKNIPPTGYSGAASTWDNVSSAPTVANGRLITNDSSAKRAYNGALESDGAVNDSSVAKALYYKVTLTTGAAPLPNVIGLSSYEIGTERLFFGKRFGSANFGLEISGGAVADTITPVAANTTYTLVAKLDYAADQISLFINPVLSAAEPAPAAFVPYTGTNSSTAVRLASGSGSPVVWDDLVVATDWESLAPVVVTTLVDEENGSLLPTAGGGAGLSLREAVKYAPAGRTITFLPGLSGGTITLNHPDGDMEIPSALTIDATALPGGITVSGNNTSRHFFVQTGKFLTLRGLTLTGASPGFQDGGSILNSGTLTLMQCTLCGNSAGIDGGAIANYGDGTLTLTQCTLSGNSASDNGGAILNFGDSALTQCTVSGNLAASNGGAIVSGSGDGGNPSTLTLNNSIVAGNSLAGAGSGADIFNEANVTRVGANLVQSLVNSGSTTVTGTGTISTADPKLSPLGYFGGPVQTMHPLIGSPAIDADAAGTANPGGTDARGFPRFVDGDNSPGNQRDIGAVEAGPLLTVAIAGDANVANNFRSLMASAPSFGKGTRLTLITGISSTIFLAQGQLTAPADNAIFIDASNLPNGLTLDGGGTNRVLYIPATATVAMHSVKIVNGRSQHGGFPLMEGANGGGILNSGSLSLFSCAIANNRAGDGDSLFFPNGGSGGGIHSSGPLSITACTVSDNSTGKGVDAAGDLLLTVGGQGGFGGGIRSEGPLILAACTLSGNRTGNGGNSDGGLFTIGGSGGSGGAISAFGDFRLIACTVARNRTGNGGTGPGGSPGAGAGGGLDGSRPTLHHCVIAENFQGSGDSMPSDVSAELLTYVGSNLLGSPASLFSGTVGPAPTVDANPLLAPLSDYGGPTFTMLPLPGSPAINATTGSTRPTDQRGLPMNGTPDLGAVETQAALVGTVDTDSDGMDDRLEIQYGFIVGVNDGNLDADGDGSRNKDELGNKTGPRDATSLLKILTFSRTGTNVTLTWTSFPGLSYTFEYGSTLNFGATVGLGTATGMTSGNTIGPITGPKAFMRIRRN